LRSTCGRCVHFSIRTRCNTLHAHLQTSRTLPADSIHVSLSGTNAAVQILSMRSPAPLIKTRSQFTSVINVMSSKKTIFTRAHIHTCITALPRRISRGCSKQTAVRDLHALDVHVARRSGRRQQRCCRKTPCKRHPLAPLFIANLPTVGGVTLQNFNFRGDFEKKFRVTSGIAEWL
jgi:hypothetical protein